VCEYFVGVLLLGVQSRQERVHCTFRRRFSCRGEQHLPSPAETDADNGHRVRAPRVPSHLSSESGLIRRLSLCVQHGGHQPRSGGVPTPHDDALLHDARADDCHHVGHQRRAVLATFHQ